MKPHLPLSLLRGLMTAILAWPLAAHAGYTAPTSISLPSGYTPYSVDAADDITTLTDKGAKTAYQLTQDISLVEWGAALTASYAHTLHFTSASADKLASITFDNSAKWLIQVRQTRALSWDSLDTISYTNNKLDSSYSLIRSDGGPMTWTNNRQILASNNEAGEGGVIAGYSGSPILMQGNGTISFTQNYAKGSGGAIVGDVTLDNNDSILFSSNAAKSSGGALSGANIAISNNGSVVFSKNEAEEAAAIDASRLISITGNSSVLFEKNLTTGLEGSELRSIWTYGDLVFAAGEKQTIRFHDAVTSKGSTSLNADYTDAAGKTVGATGTIILDATNVAADFEEMAGRSGTADELRFSRSHYLGTATLHNGTVQVQGAARLYASSMESAAGSSLVLEDGRLRADMFTLEAGATLSLDGNSYAMMLDGTLCDDSVLEIAGLDAGGTARLAGKIQAEGLVIRVDASELSKGNSYRLFTLAAGSSIAWDAADIRLEGVDAEDASLVWNKGSLYLDYGVTTATEESMQVKDGYIISETSERITHANASRLHESEGSQRFVLAEDITLEGARVTLDALVAHYEVSSEDEDAPCSLSFRGSTDAAFSTPEGPCNIYLNHLDKLSFENNSVSTEACPALFINATGEMNDNKAISFTGNYSGGNSALFVGIGAELSMQRNGSLLFEGNTARTGGAMSVLGSLEMAYSETVNFNGNQADGGSQVYGGALYVAGQGALADLHHITELKFTGNKAAMGGALASIGEGRLRIHDNGSVLFEKNQIYTTPGDIANGSALYSFNDGSIEVSDNGSVTFKENDGSAIYVGLNGTTRLTGNDSITFTGNTAPEGGAAKVVDGMFEMSGNGQVLIEGCVTSYSGAALCAITEQPSVSAPSSLVQLNSNDSLIIRNNRSGTAIYLQGRGTELQIQNNDYVLLEKNSGATETGRRLRGILAGSSNSLVTPVSVKISAAADKLVEIRDSIYVGENATLSFNCDYTDATGTSHKQKGDILITGAYVAEDLKEVQDGTVPTAEQVTESSTSEVKTMTNVYGGRLRVEDGAIYRGYGITATEGSAATVLLKDATLDHSGYDLTFHTGTTLEVTGSSAVAGNLVMKDGATLDTADSTLSLTGTAQLGSTLSLASGDTPAVLNHVSLGAESASGQVAGAGITQATISISAANYTLSDLALENVQLHAGSSTVVLRDVNVGPGSSLSADSGGRVQLAGKGSCQLGSATSLGSGVSLAADWSGTVTLTGATLAGLNMNNLGVAGSSVEFKGVSGYLNNAITDQTYAANLILTNDGNTAAWSLNNGWSGDTRIFSGCVSGSGTLQRTSWRGTEQEIIFAGDTSQWTGLLSHSPDSAAQNGVTIKTLVTFSGSSEINVQMTTNGKGEFNVTLDDANLAAGSTVSVNNTLAASSLKVTEGTTARLKSTASLGSTTLSGLNEQAATLRSVTASEAALIGNGTDALAQDVWMQAVAEAYEISAVQLSRVNFTSELTHLTLNQVSLDAACSFSVGDTGLITLSDTVLSLTLPETSAGEAFYVDLSNLFQCTVEGELTLSVDAAALMDAGYKSVSVDFGTSSSEDYSKLVLKMQDGQFVGTTGNVTSFTLIPEPATATLSLLAMLALAARRRRK